jgi:hypothetical protein
MSSLPSDAAIVHELVTVDSVAATLAALTIAVEAVDGQTLAYIDRTDDADTALCLLAQVRTQRIRLATIEASLESLAARRMRAEHRDRVELPGVGLFERRGGVDRKDWDHRGVASRRQPARPHRRNTATSPTCCATVFSKRAAPNGARQRYANWASTPTSSARKHRAAQPSSSPRQAADGRLRRRRRRRVRPRRQPDLPALLHVSARPRLLRRRRKLLPLPGP